MGARDPVRDYVAPTLLDRLIGRISPQRGLQRHFHRQLLSRAYAAASPADPWKPRRSGASANTDHQADATMLRAKSRHLIQNVEYIAAGMNARVAHIVGTGIQPKWTGAQGDKLSALWKTWGPKADADGRLDIYGLQAAAVRTMDADGEVLVRIRARRKEDGLPVPVQLQLLEVDWLDNIRVSADNGNRVTGGKEYDVLGKCVAYWLWDQHPGEIALLRARGMTSKRVPAEQIIHLYAPQRPGQQRGFPRLSPVINRVRDLQTLEDAEIARKNLETRMGVIASGDVQGLANGFEGQDLNKVGQLGELAGGGIFQAPPGMNFTVVEPKAAPGFVDYCRYNIGLVCAGAGFTYEQATGDMTKVNYSSARIRMLDFRREVEQLQWHVVVPMLCQRICDVFAEYAQLGGLIRGELSYTVDHSTPKWDYVNPLDDVQADLHEIAGGLCSFSEKIRRRGDDPEKVFGELEKDIKRLQKAGVWDALVMLLKGKPTNNPAGNAADQGQQT